jgi:hypothetical protein
VSRARSARDIGIVGLIGLIASGISSTVLSRPREGCSAGARWAKMAAMPLFGSDEMREARGARVRAEIARLEGLPLPQLAQEIMGRVYGPGGPGAGGSADYQETLKPFDPTGTGIFPGVADGLRVPLEELVQEGMQQLMNSSLVVVPLRGGDITNPRYRLTRAGRAALHSIMQ